MESVPVSTDGTGSNKGFAELNYNNKPYTNKEQVRRRDGVVVVEGGVGGGGGGQGGLSSEEDDYDDDESKNNEVANGNIQTPPPSQEPLQRQQQSQGSAGVCWERFLPLRSLKVLLVENDDSTRQVVSALLRNCSYEVTPAANGLQAWRILQDLTSHIDLILTEVVMPCMSGIALLCKIMNHKTCKNIPVIMMSSHDSMGIVFKCLSKGAVDFLVKPIRKNELKNLWQHVWRRCHSSSGSGSESAIQTQKSLKSKSAEGSDNNTGSNDEDDNASIGLGVRDGSDNGSGTQSSWTKRAVEVDSPQPMSPWNQLAHPPDSTCAQIIHPKPEESNNDWGPVTGKEECQEEDIKIHDNIPMGKDLEIGVPRNADLQLEYASENVCTNQAITDQDKLLEQDLDKSNEQLNKDILEINRKKPLGELRNKAVDNKIVVTDRINPQAETSFFEAQNGISNSEVKDKASTDANEVPSLELSLKRLRGIKDVGSATHDDRNVLRRSDLSAFSRYNTASAANQTPTGNVGSCSPFDNSSDAMKTDSMYNQQSNGSSNNNDMGSTTKNVVSKPAAFNEISASTSTAKCHPSAFQPVQNSRTCPPLHVMPQKDEDVVVSTVITQTRGANQQVQVQHHHHHYHHHHHHVHDKKQEQPPPETDELSLSMATTAVQCGSSNVFGGPNEGNTANYSLNGSGSGSNHGSNGQNGSSKPVNIGVMNNENDNVLGGKNEVGGGSGSGSGSGMDQNRFAQREAALNKFRLKRKERNFEKKVRYQSRKKLAEQRPRVRGQFVRQGVYEPTSRETKS